MRSPRRLALIAVGLIVFLVLSGLLARWLSLENVERDDIVTLLQDEARGDATAMIARLEGCRLDRNCRPDAITDARRLKRPGQVEILADQSKTAYSLTSATGFTRIAWKIVGTTFPVVQCVKVSRTGNAISGLKIRLLGVSLPIPDTSDC